MEKEGGGKIPKKEGVLGRGGDKVVTRNMKIHQALRGLLTETCSPVTNHRTYIEP